MEGTAHFLGESSVGLLSVLSLRQISGPIRFKAPISAIPKGTGSSQRSRGRLVLWERVWGKVRNGGCGASHLNANCSPDPYTDVYSCRSNISWHFCNCYHSSTEVERWKGRKVSSRGSVQVSLYLKEKAAGWVGGTCAPLLGISLSRGLLGGSVPTPTTHTGPPLPPRKAPFLNPGCAMWRKSRRKITVSTVTTKRLFGFITQAKCVSERWGEAIHTVYGRGRQAGGTVVPRVQGRKCLN